MVQTVDWAAREHMLHSYELMARHVMPHSRSAEATIASNQWAYERNEQLPAGLGRCRAREDYANRRVVIDRKSQGPPGHADNAPRRLSL